VLFLGAGVEAGLRASQPAHQLSASGASAEANPEVDAWHDAEKAKIEEECNEMMRKLWADKRQKLQDIVDALRKQVEDAKADVADLEGKLGDEKAELQKKKDAVKNVKPVDLDGPRQAVDDAQKRIDDLLKRIAELEACVEELRQAERDLEEALRRLAEAERKLAASKDAHADQVHDADVEASHVPPAQDDVDAAEDDLARAKARVAAAEKRLAKAKADLQEHDDGPHPALSVDSAAPVSEPAVAHKSDARKATMVGAIVAIMVAAFVY
jgi:chromosome segregation ATPase